MNNWYWFTLCKTRENTIVHSLDYQIPFEDSRKIALGTRDSPYESENRKIFIAITCTNCLSYSDF